MAHTYTVQELSPAVFAVMEERLSEQGTPYQHRRGICERREDAERIAYCLRVVAESEETDRRTNPTPTVIVKTSGQLSQNDLDRISETVRAAGQPK